MMRLSTTQMFHSGVSAMQTAQSKLNHTNLQMATGRRILNPSDDPSGATVSIQLSAAINTTEQHQRNLDLAQPRLEQEEAQLNTYENYLQRARELIVAGNNDTYNPFNREIMASEIRQLRDDILGIANSKDANGEYFFAGVGSFQQPFVRNGDDDIDYVAAEGDGEVRKVAISPTRSVQVGDSGKSIFMDIPEASGRLIETLPLDDNTGTLVVEETAISDYEQFELRAEESFNIEFTYNALTTKMDYAVYDMADPPVQVTDKDGNPIQGEFDPTIPIEFAGRSVTLSGVPDDGDILTSRPMRYVSIFETLDSIATAFESPAVEGLDPDPFVEAVNIAFSNIDSTLDRMNEVRTTVGLRISTMETQTNLNSERLINLNATLSDVRDLDYAEAISRYELEQTVLQAAQQTFAQVTRMSLFDYM